MSLLLCEVAVRAQVRRAIVAARHAPAVTIALTAAWLASPVVVARAMQEVAAALGPVLGDIQVARAVVIGLALPVVAMGSALALYAPEITTLGLQVAAAPVGRRALVAATLVPAVAVTAVLAFPTAVAVTVPLASSSGAGRLFAVPFLVTLLAALAAGGVAAEAVLRAVRGRQPPSLAVAAGAGAALLCSLELLARGLSRGSVVTTVLASVLAAAAAVACGFGWIGLAATRPARPPHSPRHRAGHLPRSAALFTVRIAAAVLVRRQDVRLAVTAGVSFGILGCLVGVAGARSAAIGVLLGGGSAVLAASLAPLAAGGRIKAALWTWRAGACGTTAMAWAAASGGVVACSVMPVAVLGLALGASPAVLPPLVALAALAWGAGLVAGAIVPRGSTGPLDDAAAFALLATLATVLASLTALLQPPLEAAGIPGVIAAALLLAGIGAVGIGTLAAAVERRC